MEKVLVKSVLCYWNCLYKIPFYRLIYERRKSCTYLNYFIDSWKKKYKLGRKKGNMHLSFTYSQNLSTDAVL